MLASIGIGIATTSLVGNAIGANNTELGIKYSKEVIGTVILIEILVVVPLMNVLGEDLIMLFTADATVLAIGTEVIPLLSIFAVFDAVQVRLNNNNNEY